MKNNLITLAFFLGTINALQVEQSKSLTDMTDDLDLAENSGSDAELVEESDDDLAEDSDDDLAEVSDDDDLAEASDDDELAQFDDAMAEEGTEKKKCGYWCKRKARANAKKASEKARALFSKARAHRKIV